MAPNSAWVTFTSLAVVHLLAAGWCPLLDCDEVFNYWEPLHHLVHGSGLQTWEYAPSYALRSYFYLLLHAPVVWVTKVTGLPKACEFYALRGALALVTAACEAHWLESLRRRLGPRLTQWAHFFLLVSPGTFAASAAFLPSAFAMCCLLLCQSWQLRRQGGAAVLAGGAACVVGWPFAAVALLPVGLDLVVKHGLAQCVQWGLMALAATAAPTLVADSWFYVGFQWLGRGSSADEEGSSGGGGMVFSTLNLVRYNLFPRGTGSELYGTEEWHFYLKNLALNFNVALPLSLVALPVLLVLAFWNQWAASSEASLAAAGRARAALATQQFHNCVSALSWCAPYWLWLSFFSVLPHKEERFMFVVYPQLCLSAACAATVLQTAVLPPNPRDLAVSDTGASTPPLVAKSSSKTRKTCAASQASNTAHAAQRAAAAALLVPPFGHIGSALPPLQQQQQQQPRGLPPLQALLWMLGRLRSLALVCLLVASAGLGMSRSVALVSHYGAPLDAYAWLGNHLTKERSKLEWVHKLGLHDHEIRQASTLFPPPSVMVCVGKEWYRFSSHFLLPEGAQLSFVDGGFRGQLPRAFEHRPADKGDFKATRWPLAGSDTAARFFNEINSEQRDRYVAPSECDYVVDLGQPNDTYELEPWHAQQQQEQECSASNTRHDNGQECAASTSGTSWALVYATPFLDAMHTPQAARVLWLPQWLSARLPSRFRAQHLPYQVFRRVGNKETSNS